jgi:hypothetical protein
MRPYLEKTITKRRDGGVTQGVGLEFKPQLPTYPSQPVKKHVENKGEGRDPGDCQD